jgi:hypothetical protein
MQQLLLETVTTYCHLKLNVIATTFHHRSQKVLLPCLHRDHAVDCSIVQVVLQNAA